MALKIQMVGELSADDIEKLNGKLVVLLTGIEADIKLEARLFGESVNLSSIVDVVPAPTP